MISTNQMTAQLPTATNMAELEEETVPSVLLPCTTCNRTFRPEALNKHVKYCEKTLIKKRKVFDSAKQRIQGTDLAEFLPVITHKKKNEKSPVRKTQSKWKEKHMELVRAIRAARTGPAEDLPAAPLKPCDHEKCPHCDRYFGPKAYDRHLEWCKEHSFRIQPKSPASIQAKERLEARTKYRAPLLAKSRRAIVREKYQMGGNKVRDPSPMGSNQKTLPSRLREPSPAERHQKSVSGNQVSPKQPTGLPKGELNTPEAPSRQTPLRSSRRNPSPMKKTSTPVKSKNSEGDTTILLPKEKVGVETNINSSINETSRNNSPKGKEDIFSASCNITSIQPKASPRFKLKGTNNSILPNHYNSSSPAPVPKSFINLDSTESNKQQSQQQFAGNKFCSDSAYNSLNRKSPPLEDATTIENCSSSGSECSFPPVGGTNSQAARFCHECGAKYPVLAAKFCCHCGVKRLVI